MKQTKLIFIFFLLFCFTSCSSLNSMNPLSLLTGNKWQLAGMMGKAIDAGKFADALPLLSFMDGGKLSGFTGCNNFSGDFNLEGKNISLNPGALTKKACPGSGENEFLAVLSKVKDFKVVKDKLTLMDGATELLSFIPEK
ncbi:META domain-containing protein [Cyclobacterium qasimii]|nr:META domain-containing protein [Cyclobacterium qasimii]